MTGSVRVLLSLGSNQGDRESYLVRARDRLAALPDFEIARMSFVLENPAILHEDQPDFLNQVLEAQTSLEAHELLGKLKDIEQRLGRVHRFRFGPREIDLDILTYGRQRMQTAELTLPHPGLSERVYLRTLLADLGLTPEQLLEEGR